MTTRIKKNNQVQEVWTWFKWHPCENCKKEFRREAGYSSYIKPPRNSMVDTRYLCKTCGDSTEHADKVFGEMRQAFLNYRPSVPIRPPKRK